MIRYCTRCVMPDTKPDLSFDEEGVCNACRNYENRGKIPWDIRRQELDRILEKYRKGSSAGWDCIIPVSGGKDSTFQVIRILQMGMNPLCVTATTCDLSDIGRRNLQNLKNLGVDHIELSPNPRVRRALNRIGLSQVGDISWPEHVSIFTIPVRIAVQFQIPLIIWGENSQHEYGGPANSADSKVLDRRWLEEFGGMLGLRVSDIQEMEGVREKDLLPYVYPSNEDLRRVGVTGLFLGYFLPWDGYSNTLLAQANGFETFHKTVEGSCVNYENLDNLLHGIHDYFKFLKFGFARASDIASLHVRRGRMTRQDAMEIVRRQDGGFPWTYLDVPLESILGRLNIPLEEFVKTCDRFTNKALFVRDQNKNLVKDSRGNLTKINYDNIP